MIVHIGNFACSAVIGLQTQLDTLQAFHYNASCTAIIPIYALLQQT